MQSVLVVKRRGHREKFDEKKLYASIYLACMSAYKDAMKCEKISEKITNKIKTWLKNKKAIDSSEIRKKVLLELRKESKLLAFYYDAHIPNLTKL